MRFMSADLSSQLQRKNQGLARENAVLREKCRLLEHKMQKLEKIELDSYPEKVSPMTGYRCQRNFCLPTFAGRVSGQCHETHLRGDGTVQKKIE